MRRLLALLLAAAGGCSAAGGPTTGAGSGPPEPPRPTVNHALHAQRELLCADCHDLKETGDPKIPAAETCFECHEADLAKENERVRAYFDAVRRPDGSFVFPRLAYASDLVMDHAAHARKEIACAACHGEPAETAFVRPPLLAMKDACMDCHARAGASNDCATCHREIRRENEPKDHDATFLRRHGKLVPEGWREGPRSLCALCHEQPRSCDACHAETRPSSHAAGGFRFHHGRGATDALDAPFAETSCALCHAETSCARCHAETKPRSHTVSFERRLHGIQAGIDREACTVCHKQDTCDRCHQTTTPVSHTGGFRSGQQAHCLACHEPLQDNGCFACHKNTNGHRQATPLPADAAHATATDCYACHLVLPHFDDGGSCRRCHR